MNNNKFYKQIISFALSTAMVASMLPTAIFATMQDDPVRGEKLGEIQSFGKLGDPFIPSVGKDAGDHIYSREVELHTSVEALDLPTHLTATVARTITTPVEPTQEETAPVEPTQEETTPVEPTQEETTPVEPTQEETAPVEPTQEETTTTVEEEIIPVTWESDQQIRTDVEGRFIYTAVLPEGYELADGVLPPQIYLLIGGQKRSTTAESRTLFLRENKLYIGTDSNTTEEYTGTGYSIENDTIKLNDVTFTTTAPIALSIISNATIVLSGNNTIQSTYDNTGENLNSYGVYMEDNLKIQGDGSLTAKGGNTNGISGGIGSTSLLQPSGPTMSYGFNLDGTVTVNLESGTGSETYGMHYCGSLSVSSGATLNATASSSADSESIGLAVLGKLVYQPGAKGTVQGGTQSISVRDINETVSIPGQASENFDGSKPTTGFVNKKEGSASQTIYVGKSESQIIAKWVNFFRTPTLTVENQEIVLEEDATFKIVGADWFANPSTLTAVLTRENDTSGTSDTQNITTTYDADTGGIAAEVVYIKPTYGEYTLVVKGTIGGETYEGSAKLSVTVEKVTLSSIAITTPPSKTTYQYGELFNPNGIVITATYNDTSTKAVESYTFSPNTPLTMENTTITIHYSEDGITETATQTITVEKTTATAEMKNGSTTVPDSGHNASFTLPEKPEGATYGTPATSGGMTMINISISDQILTFTAPSSSSGTTGIITIPVTGAKNYADYNYILTITSTAKKIVAIENLSAPATISYAGREISNSLFGSPTFTPNWTGDLDYRYFKIVQNSEELLDGFPKNAGSYKVEVAIPDSNQDYIGKTTLYFTINPADVTVQAVNKSMKKGGALPAFTVKYTGFIGEENKNNRALSTVAVANSSADGKTVGKFDIAITTLAVLNNTFGANYRIISQNSGTLTVNKSSSGSSGGGGGGGGGSYSYSSSTVVQTPVVNTIDSTVANQKTTAQITTEVKNALAKGIFNLNTRVTFENYTLLTPSGLQGMLDAVTKAKAGKNILLNLKANFDIVEKNAVVSRLTMDVAQLSPLVKESLKLGVHTNQTEDKEVQAVNKLFSQYFDNKLVSIVYDQKSPMALNAEICVKLNLANTFGTDKNFYFYSYNNTTNSYLRIWNPNYWVDVNQYAHITAPFGGSIVITDKPLTLKK